MDDPDVLRPHRAQPLSTRPRTSGRMDWIDAVRSRSDDPVRDPIGDDLLDVAYRPDDPDRRGELILRSNAARVDARHLREGIFGWGGR